METGNKNKLLPLSILIVLVVIGGLVYLFGFKITAPYKILAPDSYPKGTSVFLYNELPPGFPSEVILEGKPLNSSGTVATPNQKSKTTVSYISDETLTELMDMYKKNFTDKGWTIISNTVTKKTVVFQVQKGGKNLVLTLATLGDTQIMLTFQYEK